MKITNKKLEDKIEVMDAKYDKNRETIHTLRAKCG